MKDAIEKAVKTLAGKADSSETHDEAMKYSQSVLNLTHALATIDNIKNSR